MTMEMHENGLRTLSSEGLAMLGADQVAYNRPRQVNGQTIYMEHGANGQELAGFADRTGALAACLQYDLEAVGLH